MNKKQKIEKQEVIEHRDELYDNAIQRLIDGKETPEYVTYRWKKLKRIKRGK